MIREAEKPRTFVASNHAAITLRASLEEARHGMSQAEKDITELEDRLAKVRNSFAWHRDVASKLVAAIELLNNG